MANIWIELDVYGYDSPEEQKAMELAGKEDVKPENWSSLMVNMSQVAYMQVAKDASNETELTMSYGGVITARMSRHAIMAVVDKANDTVLLQDDTEDLPTVQVIERGKEDGTTH